MAAALPAMWQMAVFAQLGARQRQLAGGSVTYSAPDLPLDTIRPELREPYKKSLDEFTEFFLVERPQHERLVLSLWSSYAEMMTQALAGRESLAEAVSAAQWRDMYVRGDRTLI